MKMLLIPSSGKGVLVGVEVSVGADVTVSTVVGVAAGSAVADAAETMTADAGASGAGWRLINSTRTAITATNKVAAPPSQRLVLDLLFEGGWYDTVRLLPQEESCFLLESGVAQPIGKLNETWLTCHCPVLTHRDRRQFLHHGFLVEACRPIGYVIAGIASDTPCARHIAAIGG